MPKDAAAAAVVWPKKSSRRPRLVTSVLVVLGAFMVWNLFHSNKGVGICTGSISATLLSWSSEDDDVEDLPPLTPHVYSSTNYDKYTQNNPLTGLFPGWNHTGSVQIDRNQSLDNDDDDEYDENEVVKQILLPERLIAVFGLESSGTTFIQQSLAQAVGATNEDDTDSFLSVTPDHKTQIQHFTLPHGVFISNAGNDDDRRQRQFEPLSLIPVAVPQRCRMGRQDGNIDSPHDSPPECHSLYGPTLVPDPPGGRFFVNITSHLRFYQQRGVNATAVIVVRDPALHFRGIVTPERVPNHTAAFQQYQTGRALLQQALDLLDASSVVVVSYETLMTLKQVYWKEHVYKALQIDSDYIPNFENENIKYIPENLIPSAIVHKLKRDTGVPSHLVIPKNLYEPKSWAQVQQERHQQQRGK